MNTELKDLLNLVKNSNKPAREVIEAYMSNGWSLLIDEWNRMSSDEREAFINKVEDYING